MAWLIAQLLDRVLPHRPKPKTRPEVDAAFRLVHERRMAKRREVEQLKTLWRMPAYDPEEAK